MTPKEFIEKRLTQLTPASHMPPTGNVADAIYTALMSKKFRKYGNSDEQKENIKKAIAICVENNKPIRMGLPFGAYKLWRLEEAPEADWAELFTLIHFLRWLKPITDMYAPGVHFEFLSDAVVIERMNNVPKEDTNRYKQSLEALFVFLKSYTPANFTYSLFETGSLYAPEEFDAELSQHMQEILDQNSGHYPLLNDDSRRSVELNVKLKPKQDSDPLWADKVELIHRAYYMMERRAAYYKSPDRVAAFPTPLSKWACIAVGTTKTSIAKFWVGVGALKPTSDSYIETILSPTQLEKAHFTFEPLTIHGLEGRNFNKIRVLTD